MGRAGVQRRLLGLLYGRFCRPVQRPTDYLNLPSEPRYGYAETPAQDEHAIDFIIEQVHKYPGEVTIFVIGAGTNMALAVRKDPTIVEDAAGVYYMGGAIDIRGNSNAAAEFNWYYDPEGIKICLNSAWKDQLIVPNDIAEAVFYTKEIYDRIAEKQGNAISTLIVEGQKSRYENDPRPPASCGIPSSLPCGSSLRLPPASRSATWTSTPTTA